MNGPLDPLPASDYLVGAVFFGLMLGASLAAAALVLRRRLPELTGVPAAIAFGLLAVLAVFAAHLLPGMVGVLSRETASGAGLLLLAGAWLLPRRAPGERPVEFPEAPSADRISWAVAAGTAGVVVLYVLAFLVDHGSAAAGNTDMTTFHLPGIAGWIEHGDLWRVESWSPYWALGNYPNTSDVMTLAAVMPWDHDFLVRFVNVPFLALTWAGVYGAARELGAPAPASVLAGAVLLAMPVVMSTALDGLSDTLMLATYAGGVYFLLRHRRTSARSDLVLAGLGLGLSLGTKWYAVPVVTLTLLVWACALLLERRPVRALGGQGTLLGGIVLAAGGFWMLRNLVQTGNPVFPAKVEPFGITIFDAPRDRIRELRGATLGDFIGDWDVWADVLYPSFVEVMGYAALLLWAVLAGAIVLALRPSLARVGGRAVIALGVVAVLISLAYLITPYSGFNITGQPDNPAFAWVNARYIVPALLIAAIIGAWAAGRVRRLTLGVLEVLAVVAVVDGLRRDTITPGAGAWAVAILGLLALLALFLLGRWRGFRPRQLSRPALAAGVALTAAALVIVGYVQERRYAKIRYVGLNGAFDYINNEAPSGQRVGLLGEGRESYPAWGPRLGNSVEFIGPVVDEMLRSYETRPEFERAVERGRFDLVLVQDSGDIKPELPARQEGWLRGLGYGLVAEGRVSRIPLRLYSGGPSLAGGATAAD